MMFLSDAQSDFRSAELTAQNAAADASDPRAAFRAAEIVAQNQAATASNAWRSFPWGVLLLIGALWLLKPGKR